MRASTAYFIGAGTIVAAIAIGLGGGIVAGNIMHPVTPKQGPDTAKYEARTEQPVAAVTASVPSERAQSLTGSPPAPQTRTANTDPSASAAVANDAKTTDKTADKTAEAAPAAAPATSAKPVERQAAREPSPVPENAYAKASASDVKRVSQERRRAERRQHWSERRRHELREPRDRTNWDDIARNVREDSDGREFIATRRYGSPQIRLFGSDDD